MGAGGEGYDRGWDGWMASPTQWIWVWVNSGSWWWTGRPGVLQFMGLQRVGHDWATELNWTELSLIWIYDLGFTRTVFNHLSISFYTIIFKVFIAGNSSILILNILNFIRLFYRLNLLHSNKLCVLYIKRTIKTICYELLWSSNCPSFPSFINA